MPSKPQRHQRILELVGSERIRSQEELRRRLESEQIQATQATLSRDLHDLGVAKGPEGYSLPRTSPFFRQRVTDIDRTLKQEIVSIRCGGSTVVLRTRPGHADPVAFALDHSGWDDILGTIAGDDTIFVAAHSDLDAVELAARLRGITGVNHE